VTFELFVLAWDTTRHPWVTFGHELLHFEREPELVVGPTAHGYRGPGHRRIGERAKGDPDKVREMFRVPEHRGTALGAEMLFDLSPRVAAAHVDLAVGQPGCGLPEQPRPWIGDRLAEVRELNGKRQEILMDLLPTVRHTAALADANASTPQHLQMLQELTRARGVELSVYRVSEPEEIAGAIDKAKSSGAGALNVLASPFLFNRRQAIREQVANLSLPAMYMAPDIAEEGGLIAYGANIVGLWGELMARQLAALLRGAKVADVPVEQPTKFELAINLKAAKALGLNIPESFLIRADEVIE
jgi:hypothetical protein